MATFLALYTGATIGEARMIAVSADAKLVSYVAHHLLDELNSPIRSQQSQDEGTALTALQNGRKRALRAVIHPSTKGGAGEQRKKRHARRRCSE